MIDIHPIPWTEDAILVVDPSMRIMSSNESAWKLLGRNLHAGHVRKPESFAEKDSVERLGAAIKQALEHGQEARNIQIATTSPDGARFLSMCSLQPLLAKGDAVVGVVLNIQPVTVARAAEAGSNKQPEERPEVKHYELLESLPEGVFTINTRWRIASFNRMAEEITGFRRNEVLGRYCWEIFRSDLCHAGCPLRAALDTGHTCSDQDVRIIHKDGRRHTILVNTGVLNDHQGTVVGAVETFRPLICEIGTRKGVLSRYTFDNIVGKSPEMRRLFAMLPDVAASDTNVLITGESGTGKELFARSIHHHSPRRDGPFVAVNCASLAESLIESELFGHEKAAFTGATGARAGRFETASGGTLFLDEIGEFRTDLQIKLLRVLEQREFERVGGLRAIPMQARIVSATNRDLKAALQNGAFREDFYYRLRTVPIAIPPLRQRKEDIPLLVEFFITRLNRLTHKCVRGVDVKVMEFFMDYDWPGNVRELERTLEYAFVFVKGATILRQNLPGPEEFGSVVSPAPPDNGTRNSDPRSRETILWALSRAGGKKQAAAQMLGLSRTTLWRRMKKLGIS